MPIHTIHPEQYQQQFNHKLLAFQKSLTDALGDISASPFAVYPSAKSHYRLRAEFKIWHDSNIAQYAMTDPKTKKIIFITDFPVANKKINALMPLLLEAINSKDILRKKCFQVEFLSTLNDDTLITMIYHKPLSDEWVTAITPIQEKIKTPIIGRSRKQKLVLKRDYVNEKLTIVGRNYHYKQIEGGFTQPNGAICEKMITWVIENSREFTGDLLELYCGNGNFTLPLAQHFNRVMATEMSKTSVNAALDNIRANDIDNVTIIRMSSEDFVLAMDNVRPFRRLKDIDLDEYQFSTVFVDPPRAGLDDATVKMIQRFENIIYISCNTDTLIKNLLTLTKTHSIHALAAFDQFPYTDHLESGVILSIKTTK